MHRLAGPPRSASPPATHTSLGTAPIPTARQPSQHSTHQQISNASAQQVPWPDGSKPAMSDRISSQAQFGGTPVQQAQQAPRHWGQQGSSDSRNWYDVTEQEQQAQQAPQHQTYYDWDTGATCHDTPSQPDPWANWDQAPNTGKGKGKHANTQQQTQQQQQQQQQQQSQQPSWSNSWQQGSGKGKSWDHFSSNADWTNQPPQQHKTPHRHHPLHCNLACKSRAASCNGRGTVPTIKTPAPVSGFARLHAPTLFAALDGLHAILNPRGALSMTGTARTVVVIA